MTERRPPYDALSGTTEDSPLHQGTISVVSPREQHTSDSAPSQDILLLLPILESPESPEQNPVCLHLIHLPDGHLGLCNGKAEGEVCPGCGLAMCQEHTSRRFLLLADRDDLWSDDPIFLCTVCASLTNEQIHAYQAFRWSINTRPCMPYKWTPARVPQERNSAL